MQQTEDRKDEWAIERDRYAVLLHLYNVRDADPTSSLSAERLTRDLGFEWQRARDVVDSLMWADYVQYSGLGEGLILTARAIRYIEKEARRRRSVRLPD